MIKIINAAPFVSKRDKAKNKKKRAQEKGAALLLSIILILSVSLIIGLGLSSLGSNSLVIARNKILSTKSYYIAEAGIEDSLLRIKNEMQFSSPNTLIIGNSSTTIEISEEIIGGSWAITSQGDTNNRIRKLTVTYGKITGQVSFYYGAQAGEGGVVMGNNSQIIGNLFSNGSILPGGGGRAEVTDTAIVALNGNKIEKTDVGGDAYAYSCKNSDITGTLYYVTGGTITNCDYASLVELANEIEAEDLPILPEQIIDWKDEATAGGTFSGDYILDDETGSLGPIKIIGNLLVENNSVFTMTGLIYVTGNITIQNNSTLQLDENFGLISGIIISDGKIIIDNNAIIQGSGQTESFLMVLSTNNSLDPNSPAIDVSNNTEGAIFYTSNGLIHLHNNINVKEATGYKLTLDNNTVISYETGLENVNFTSGPGGAWRTEDWQEIE